LLRRCLEQGGEDRTGGSVGQRHALHVGKRERESAPRGDAIALADDDARQNGIIGRTHGVSESTNPPTRKSPISTKMLPLRTMVARLSCSATCVAPAGVRTTCSLAGSAVVAVVGGSSTDTIFEIGL